MLTHYFIFVYTSSPYFPHIPQHNTFLNNREAEKIRAAVTAALIHSLQLLLFKRSTVRALIHRGVAFVRSHGNSIQRTVILRAAVVLTLGDLTLDAMIRVLHTESSFPNWKLN